MTIIITLLIGCTIGGIGEFIAAAFVTSRGRACVWCDEDVNREVMG